jgi:hypothetical protein
MKLTGLGYRKIRRAYLETAVEGIHDCEVPCYLLSGCQFYFDPTLAHMP